MNDNTENIRLECDSRKISVEYFLGALNSIDPNSLSQSEIAAHGQWCTEQIANEDAEE
jgi:hypothetical protein